jgi:hypothetical protein
MSPRHRIGRGVRQLLEQQYLESTSEHAKDEYAGMSDDEKRTTLKAFPREQTGASEEQWVKVLQDLL